MTLPDTTLARVANAARQDANLEREAKIDTLVEAEIRATVAVAPEPQPDKKIDAEAIIAEIIKLSDADRNIVLRHMHAAELGTELPQNTHGTVQFNDLKTQVENAQMMRRLYRTLREEFNGDCKSVKRNIDTLEFLAEIGTITAQNVTLYQKAYSKIEESLKVEEQLWGTKYYLGVGSATTITSAASVGLGYLTVQSFIALEGIATMGWVAGSAAAIYAAIAAGSKFTAKNKEKTLQKLTGKDAGMFKVAEQFAANLDDFINGLEVAIQYSSQLRDELASPKHIVSKYVSQSAKVVRDTQSAHGYLNSEGIRHLNALKHIYSQYCERKGLFSW